MTRSGITMSLHPKITDRDQPLGLQPLIGHPGLGRQCPRQMPVAFSADRRQDRLAFARPQTQLNRWEPSHQVAGVQKRSAKRHFEDARSIAMRDARPGMLPRTRISALLSSIGSKQCMRAMHPRCRESPS